MTGYRVMYAVPGWRVGLMQAELDEGGFWVCLEKPTGELDSYHVPDLVQAEAKAQEMAASFGCLSQL